MTIPESPSGPDVDVAWASVQRSLPVGSRVTGVVISHHHFGFFVRIDGVPFPGLVEITNLVDEGRMNSDLYPMVGRRVAAVVLGFRASNHQIGLGIRPSQLDQAGE